MNKRTQFIIGIAGALMLAVVLIIVTSSTPDRTAVEVIRILLNWPVVVLVLVLLFLLLFRSQISKFLDNMQMVRAGTVEIVASQPEPETTEEPPPVEADSEKHPTAEMDEELQQRILQVQRTSLFWYFRYLSIFLVPRTKSILKMIVDAGQLPRQTIDIVLGPPIPKAEKEAILDALTANGLVEEADGLLVASPYAVRFQAFLEGRIQDAVAVNPPQEGPEGS